MKLGHISLTHRLTSYAYASHIQNVLRRNLLLSKQPSAAHAVVASPSIITAQFYPVYTCGRRELSRLSAQQIAHLRVDSPYGRPSEFHECLRGGQTTYHGPGQLTAYPILDLKSFHLGARTYIHLLEEAVIRTIDRYGIKGIRTENPGVWMAGGQRKICAVGVRLRRNVSSHGIGLNVEKKVMWGFDRIVGCGLEGKQATSLEAEGVAGITVDEVGKAFVDEMRTLLGVEFVYDVAEDEMLGSGFEVEEEER